MANKELTLNSLKKTKLDILTLNINLVIYNTRKEDPPFYQELSEQHVSTLL
jgi:hypothetical protein